MFCPTCKAGMTPMIVSWFCPNNCDRVPPLKSSKVRKIPTRLGNGLVVVKSADIPETAQYFKWWAEGQGELDEKQFPFTAHIPTLKDTKHVWKEIDSQSFFLLRTANNMKILGAIYVI